MKLILASGSPRRTELLTQIGLSHIVIVSQCEEVITKERPEEVVMELAEEKAGSVFISYGQEMTQKNTTEDEDLDYMVLGSDTVVVQGGHILGKPKDEEDAFRMIKTLQGATHQVYTGVALLARKNGEEIRNVFYECSQVRVYPMTDDEIWDYIHTGEPMDKAGAYGIQGRFGAYVEGIEGDYNTIVGLPVARVYQEYKKMISSIF